MAQSSTDGLTGALMNPPTTSLAANDTAAGLPACSWRMPTRLPGTYYCRHSSVHSLNDLVDSTICRVCNQAALPARLPRPVLSDPLAPRKKYTASEELEYISLERLAADASSVCTYSSRCCCSR